MCLCLFAVNAHDEFPFILIANRDEFRTRPASIAAFWEEHPNVLAGRDLQGMGTWLGMNKSGKIAFLTNYRHPDYFNRKGPTRGTLVSNFLTSERNGKEYLDSVQNPTEYNGFNLVVGSLDGLYYYSNVEGKVKPINSGVHGLSNAFLNTSWPKVDDGKEKLKSAIEKNDLNSNHLFSILADGSFAKESELPETGVSQELEKVLSAKFINTPNYGTVCSTVIKIDRNGKCFFEEKTFNEKGLETGKVSYEFSTGFGS
jgi:uncharacterized protein with NRDE domain